MKTVTQKARFRQAIYILHWMSSFGFGAVGKPSSSYHRRIFIAITYRHSLFPDHGHSPWFTLANTKISRAKTSESVARL